jgi:hypothetical protein
VNFAYRSIYFKTKTNSTYALRKTGTLPPRNYLIYWQYVEWIFRRWDVGVWTGLSWLRKETVGRQL